MHHRLRAIVRDGTAITEGVSGGYKACGRQNLVFCESQSKERCPPGTDVAKRTCELLLELADSGRFTHFDGETWGGTHTVSTYSERFQYVLQ